MKIVATIANFAAAANIGGNVEYESFIVDIPDNVVPKAVKDYLNDSQLQTLSFSILKEVVPND